VTPPTREDPPSEALPPPSGPAGRIVGRWRAHPVDGGPTTRAVLRIIAIVLSVTLLLWLLWLSRSIVVWVGIAALLACAINPLVGLLQGRGRMPRWAAILVVYVIGLGVATGVAFTFVPPLITAAQNLAEDVPGYVDEISNARFVERLDEEYDILRKIEDGLTGALGDIAGPGTAVDLAQNVLNGLIALISIAVICFLLSLNGPRLRQWWIDQAANGEQRERILRLTDRMYRVVAGYVVGVVLVGVCGAVAVYVFLTIAGVPYAVLLSAWVALAALVPMVGATIGGVPYIAVAFFQGWPTGVAAIVFLLVYQQVENNLIQPAIHRRTVQLNALWIILAVLVGAQVLGILGALVAIPVAGIIQVLVQEWWAVRRGVPPPEGGEDSLAEAAEAAPTG
jgi:predicted PurR-regulated permease PerM